MKKWKGKTRWLAVLLSLCVVAAVMPMTALAEGASNEGKPNIVPAFAGEQMVSVGYGDFEAPHYFELLENDKLKAVTGTVSYYQVGETPHYSYDTLKAYLSACTAGSVINCDFAFQGDGDYVDFKTTGTLTFTMVGGVDKVNITIDAPQTGKKLAATASAAGSSADVAVAEDCLVVSKINWYKEGESAGASNNTVAAANTTYTASFVVHTDRGVAFADNVANAISVTVNGTTVSPENVQLNYVNGSYQLEGPYTFAETGAAPVIDQVHVAIDAPRTGWPLATTASVTSCSASGQEVDTGLLTVKSVEWGEPWSSGWLGGTTPTMDTVAAPSKVYTVTIELTASDVTFQSEGYDYSGITTTVNGQSAIPYTMDWGARCAVTYTFAATGDTIEAPPVIDQVHVTIDAPQTGKPLATTASVTASAGGVAVDSSLLTVEEVTWFEYDGTSSYPIYTSDTIAAANKKYGVTVKISVNSGATFVDTKATVNSESVGYAGVYNGDYTVCYVGEVFDETGAVASDPIYSTPVYSITAPSKVEGGTVTASRISAAMGATVTITVTPDDGYELDTLTATDARGNELTLTDKGSGKYTFTMPASKVTVEASFAKSASPAPSFVDVPSNAYYAGAVNWAVENGITLGTSAGTTFSPNEGCTRAQVVTFLWRAAGCPAPKTSGNPFADISVSAYYYEAVLWAVENGITVGTGDGTTFSPDVTCSRAQIVTFLWRSEDKPAASTVNSFVDVDNSAYYADAVEWAVQNGITLGTNAAGTVFSPDGDCTRAQIVTFLYRAYN